MRQIWFGAAALMVAGCTASYGVQESAAPPVGLDPGGTVLISTPENGTYDGRQYQHSGDMVADALRAAFLKHARTVSVTDSCRDDDCLPKAESQGVAYYVQPIILHWEDRATEWSGVSDRLEVLVKVFDVPTRILVSSYSFSGKSKWATFGGDHPQDLLPDPTNAYVDGLYRR